MLSTQHRSIVSRHILQIALAALGAGSLLLAPAVRAEDESQSKPLAQSSTPAVPNQKPISDQKLGAAAAAMDQVASLNKTYQQQLASAPPAEKQRITGEANKALAKAVADQGLTVDEYNGILQAALSNPSVRDGLMKHMHPADPSTSSAPSTP